MLLRRAAPHHVLDTGPVVPAPVENDDFASGREVLQVALHVDLRLLPIGRRWQRDDAEHPGAEALSERANRAALPRAIASFEDDDYAEPFLLYPPLEMAQPHLQFLERLLVFVLFHELISPTSPRRREPPRCTRVLATRSRNRTARALPARTPEPRAQR